MRRAIQLLKEWADGTVLRAMLRLGETGRVGSISVGTVGAGGRGGAEGAAKATEALQILKRDAPNFFSVVQRETRGVIVVDLGGRGEIGRWKQTAGVCLLDVRHAIEDDPTLIAATIVHEASHGRLLRAGIGYGEMIRRRVEMICARRMIRFAEKLPSGIGRDAIMVTCGNFMKLPWSYWSDEKKALEVASRGARGWKSMLGEAEEKAGKRRGREAGHGGGLEVAALVTEGLLGGGKDDPWEVARCSVRVSNKCGRPLKIAWGGWMTMTDEGEWREVVTRGGEQAGNLYLEEGGQLELEDELVPLDGVFQGAMWVCVGVDASGRTYYGEAILSRQASPSRWRSWDEGAGADSLPSRSTNFWRAGLHVSHRELDGDRIMAIEGARGLVGRIAREYGEDIIFPYGTEVANRCGEDVRVLWMQSYSHHPKCGWAGCNIMGRSLGPADFVRWFGGEGVSEGGWITKGAVARCDLGWQRGMGGEVRWAYRAIGRSGEMYEGGESIRLEQPLSISALLRRGGGGEGLESRERNLD
jgi:hypothetical protein